MRLWGCFAVASAVACYRAPAPANPCAVTCETQCPEGYTCTGGFCLKPGQVCQPSFTHVAAGTGFGCGLDDRDALWCWGSNAHHQIDPGATATYPLATRVASDLVWGAIDAGGDQICGISTGQLYCWGGNASGEAAATVSGDVAVPTRVSIPQGPSSWTAISAGLGYTCAIGDAKLFCWGANTTGQLGTGDTVDVRIPTQVGTDSDWAAVATGSSHTCAIKTTGELACWGRCSGGECGAATMSVTQTTPVAVGVTATSVATASEATCITTPQQELECFGANFEAELGEAAVVIGGTTSTPVIASTVTGWTSVAAAEAYMCGLANSDVYCWGTARSGGIGRGFWYDGPAAATPSPWFSKVATGATEVAVGANYDLDPTTKTDVGDLDLSCALIGTELECWGDNRFGQLASGGATMATTPTAIAGGHHWSDLELGDDHACGIENGSLSCWGSTELGATLGVIYGNSGSKKPCAAGATAADRLCDLGTPRPIMLVPGSDAISLGSGHTCSLQNTIVTCWGDNSFGQLGAATPAAPAARRVNGPGGVGWTKLVSTGRDGQCGIPTSAGTFCWGSVLAQVPTPTHELALDGVDQVVMGGSVTQFTCALDASGSFECAGADPNYAFGDGTITPQPTLTSLGRPYTTIAAYAHGDTVCGVAGADRHVDCWGANPRGQTGAYDAGTGAVIDPTKTPGSVMGLASCTALAVGALHACALCAGTVSCWGDNSVGQLGAGPPTPSPSPVPQLVSLPILDGDPWIGLAASRLATCARSQSGAGYCWGFGFHGALGNGAVSANLPVGVLAQPIP